MFLTLGVNFPGNFISRKASTPSFLSIFRLYMFGIRGSPAGLPALNSPDHEHNLLDYFKVEYFKPNPSIVVFNLYNSMMINPVIFSISDRDYTHLIKPSFTAVFFTFKMVLVDVLFVNPDI